MGSFNGEPFLQRFVTLAIPSHFEMREGLGKSETIGERENYQDYVCKDLCENTGVKIKKRFECYNLTNTSSTIVSK